LPDKRQVSAVENGSESKILPEVLIIMETLHTTPVTFTKGAIKELKRLFARENKSNDKMLRIGVKGGGCSGMTYILDFDYKTDNDLFFEVDNIPCIMNRAHGLYLSSMEIDFDEGLNARGFTFTNPNASTTCGCGHSFGV
jgi:iron-sulfur cluster assembly accessory protein